MFLIMEPAEREAVLGAVADYLAVDSADRVRRVHFPLWTLAQRTVRR